MALTIERKGFDVDHDEQANRWNRTVPIVTTPDPTPGSPEQTTSRHPAFGQIGASRVSGGTYLYGSEFQHQHFVRLTIRRSELVRHLSNDWHHGREELIEISMSEAQWATFVSSMNVGFGVPCTIHHIGGEPVPGIESVPERSAQFSGELAQDFAEARESLDELEKQIAAMGLSGKKQEELRKTIEKARSRIGGSVKFVADQFDEHMERTKEAAKIEVNAYATQMVQRAGLTALGAPVQFVEALPAPKE